jgi:hypothetical protein
VSAPAGLIPLPDCPAEDRRRAIQCAARVMETVWPKLQHSATVQAGGRQLQAMFVRLPSGALRVVQRDTGELIAQSLPAPLAVLDPEPFGIDLDADTEQALDSLADSLTPGRVLCGLAELLALPCFKALTVPELAYVLRVWADRLGDD